MTGATREGNNPGSWDRPKSSSGLSWGSQRPLAVQPQPLTLPSCPVDPSLKKKGLPTMQVDPNAPSSSTASSSSSSQYGGWAAFPSAHATTPAFNSFGQPQPHSQQQLEQQQQLQHLANMQQNQSHYPMNGYGASLKRTRSNDGQAPEPSAVRPLPPTRLGIARGSPGLRSEADRSETDHPVLSSSLLTRFIISPPILSDRPLLLACSAETAPIHASRRFGAVHDAGDGI